MKRDYRTQRRKRTATQRRRRRARRLFLVDPKGVAVMVRDLPPAEPGKEASHP